MKHKLLILSALGAAGLLTTAARAENTITIIGSVVGSSCETTLNSTGSASGTVALQPVHINTLPAPNSTSGDRTFTISLNNCGQNNAPVVAKTYFYSPNATNVTDGRLNKVSGSGSGWQYQILDGTGTKQISVGSAASAVPNSSDAGVRIGDDGAGKLTYRVRYYRDGDTVEQGNISSHVAYVVYYE